MLDRHPISLLFGESEDRVASAFPYCRLWLQRYASDVSVPTAARKTVVLLAAVVPAALLPATLHSIAADASSVRPLLAWVWVFLLIAAAVAVANSLREGRTLVLSIFYQFVLVQFVEQGAPSRDRREGESRSDIASDA